MRALARNEQTVYYALYSGKTKVYDSNGLFTGEHTISYEAPVKTTMNISPASGSATVEMFGINTNYSRVMVTDDLSCPIKEDTVLWVGTEPGQDGADFNYRVTAVAKSLNSVAYAITEAKSAQHQG